MKKIKFTQKVYQTLNPLLINITGKKKISHQIKKAGMSLKKIIKQ